MISKIISKRICSKLSIDNHQSFNDEKEHNPICDHFLFIEESYHQRTKSKP